MMQQYRFRPLQRDEIPLMLDLIHLRIAWMDQVGIRQWNVTDYDGVYPPAYYQACYDLGELFALEELSTGRIVCVGALKAKDPRWPDAAPDAFYLHHLAADPAHKGAGRAFSFGERKRRRRLPEKPVSGWIPPLTTPSSPPIMSNRAICPLAHASMDFTKASCGRSLLFPPNAIAP